MNKISVYFLNSFSFGVCGLVLSVYPVASGRLQEGGMGMVRGHLTLPEPHKVARANSGPDDFCVSFSIIITIFVFSSICPASQR